MAKGKEALGRGIRALLDGIDDDAVKKGKDEEKGEANSPFVRFVELGRIEINPFQPRTQFNEDSLNELAISVGVHGVLQPLTVKQLGGGKFQLIAGERRLRASKMAGLKEVPVFIRTANEQETLEIALIENIQREDLNAIEIGLTYKRLLDECNLSHEELAERLGKKRSTISNFLRLLKLPPDVQAGLKNEKISMGHAKVILGVDDVALQIHLFHETVKKGLSVRQLEGIVKLGVAKPKSSKKQSLNYEMRKLQDDLSSYLGTKVQLKPGANGKGELKISWFSEDDLERLRELIVHDD